MAVIKGKSRGQPAQLANYLVSKRDNDSVRVLGIRGTATPHDLKRSLVEMSLMSEFSKGDKGLYHAQINPRDFESQIMTDEQWGETADILEKSLKLEKQKRAIVLHEKNGRVHAHVVWERYDHERNKLISDSHNYKAHDRARAELEKRFEHEMTPQKRDKSKEIAYKDILTGFWHQSSSGHEFKEKVECIGCQVARGLDRRPYKVITHDGVSLDLVRQLKGVKTAEVRERLQYEKLETEADALRKISEEKKREIDKKRNEFINNFKEFEDNPEVLQVIKMMEQARDISQDQRYTY